MLDLVVWFNSRLVTSTGRNCCPNLFILFTEFVALTIDGGRPPPPTFGGTPSLLSRYGTRRMHYSKTAKRDSDSCVVNPCMHQVFFKILRRFVTTRNRSAVQPFGGPKLHMHPHPSSRLVVIRCGHYVRTAM